MTLEEAIAATGQKQAQLCRMFGLNETHLSGIKTGSISPVRRENSIDGPGFTRSTKKACAALGVSPEDIWPEHVRAWVADPRRFTPARTQESPEDSVAMKRARLGIRLQTRRVGIDRDMRAVRMHFGIGRKRSMTLKEVAAELGIAPSRARELVARGVRYLRHPKSSGAISEHFEHLAKNREAHERRAAEWRLDMESGRQLEIEKIQQRSAEHRRQVEARSCANGARL